MNTRQVCDQWFEINRAALEPMMRWNEIALQTAEKVAGNRQTYDQWFDMSRAAMDPFLRWNEIAFQAAERITRRNLSFAQDYLELGVRQSQLLCEVRDPQKWKDEEGKLVDEFSKKMVDHAGEYLTVARETHDAINNWAEKMARETAERATKAAETAAKATAEAARPAAEGAPRPAPGPQPQKA